MKQAVLGFACQSLENCQFWRKRLKKWWFAVSLSEIPRGIAMLLNSRKRSLSDHFQWLFFLCGLLLKIQEVKVKSSSLFMCVLIWGWAGNGNFLKVVAFVNPFQKKRKAFFIKSILLCFPVSQTQTVFKPLLGNAVHSLAGPGKIRT